MAKVHFNEETRTINPLTGKEFPIRPGRGGMKAVYEAEMKAWYQAERNASSTSAVMLELGPLVTELGTDDSA